MYFISELADRVGLSRTTLLYYEKLGLLKGKRQANGYRAYSDLDRQRLELLQKLQAGGLSLQECHACLNGKLDRDMLELRLKKLTDDIAEKARARDLLAALLGQGSLKDWHEALERAAPDLHRSWLMTQGFSNSEAAKVAWLSKDMNAHDAYMKDFMTVFGDLECWGPSTKEATMQALRMIPFTPERILEIGCGQGAATLPLAEVTSAQILAIDTDDRALARLDAEIIGRGFDGRVSLRNLDMGDLPEMQPPWDVIWSEGSAYLIGVERALQDWKTHLRSGGVVVFSDMVWRELCPPEDLRAYWASEYPTMTTVPIRLSQAKRAGYQVLGHFDMGRAAMDAYYLPLEARVEAMGDQLKGSRVLEDLRAEIAAYHACDGIVSFEMIVLQKP